MCETGTRLFSIGHSNHEASDFFRLLTRHRIVALLDVRSIPSSRFPHFKKRSLEQVCAGRGISYRHCPELGNKVDGIAHLLQQPEGQVALSELATAAHVPPDKGATAYMCAEAHWTDCHRQVIAQRLREEFGISTFHILRSGSLEVHPSNHVLPASYGIPPRLVNAYSQDACCSELDTKGLVVGMTVIVDDFGQGIYRGHDCCGKDGVHIEYEDGSVYHCSASQVQLLLAPAQHGTVTETLSSEQPDPHKARRWQGVEAAQKHAVLVPPPPSLVDQAAVPQRARRWGKKVEGPLPNS